MQNSLKKGLASIILGAAFIFASDSSNLYSQEQNKSYSNQTAVNYQGSKNNDVLFVGLTTLGAYCALRGLRKKQ